MDCCICSEKAISVIEYTDKFGKQIKEPRCEPCAKAVIENDDNEVHTDVKIQSNDDEDEETFEDLPGMSMSTPCPINHNQFLI